MSRKKPEVKEFVQNFANDGKKLLGPAPRIGLSRKVRPSPKLFKSPLLNPPVTYPNYSGSSPSLQENDLNSTPKEKENISVRVSNRKKAKKNLQDDFEGEKSEREVGVDNLTTLKETSDDNIVINKRRSVSPENKMAVDIDKLLKSPVLAKSEKSPELVEMGGRKSGRAKVAKKFVDAPYEEDEQNEEIHQKEEKKTTVRNNKKNQKKNDHLKTLKEDSSENVVKTDVDVLNIEQEDVKKVKGRAGRPKRRIITDDDELPPNLSAITPQKVVKPDGSTRSTRSAEKKSPDCPLLSPQEIRMKILTPLNKAKPKKVARRIVSDDESDKEAESSAKQDGGEATQPETIGNHGNEVNKRQNISDDSDDDIVPLAVIAKTNTTKPSNPLRLEIPPYKKQDMKQNPNKMRFSLSLKRSSASLSTCSDDKMAPKANETKSTTDLETLSNNDLQLEMLRNEVSAVQQQVESKEDAVATISRKKQKIEELDALTKTWENGSKEALIALHQKMTAMGENIDMDVLLKKFNAQDKFKFDSFEYSFV